MSKVVKDCISCSRYIQCTNSKKKYGFVCSKYSTNESSIIKPKKSGLIIKSKEIIKPDAFDLRAVVGKAIKRVPGLPPGHRFDDDVPRAPNFFTFVFGAKYLNAFLNPKQIEIGSLYYSEVCPYCSDWEYAQNIKHNATLDEIQERVVFTRYGKCPKCKRTKLDFWNDGYPNYNEVAVCAGQRSGKSSVVALMSCYTIHQYIMVGNISTLLELLPDSYLDCSYVATTKTQVFKSIFQPLLVYLESTPWFTAYHQHLDEVGARLGRKLYNITKQRFEYLHKRIRGAPEAPSGHGLRGLTRFCGGLDEVGHLSNREEDLDKAQISAPVIYDAVFQSYATVANAVEELHKQGYYQVPQVLFCNVSSPSDVGDMIVQLTKEKPKQYDRILARTYTTFDMNPRLNAKQGFYKSMRASNPVMYRTNVLADPPLAHSPWFGDESEKIVGTFIAKRTNCLALRQHTFTHNRRSFTTASVKFIRKVKRPTILVLDAGETNNSFSGALMGVDHETGRIVIEGVFEVIPSKKNPVNFTALYDDCITKIIKHYNVRCVFADQWNSSKILTDISMEHNIDAIRYSLKPDDFLAIKVEITENPPLGLSPEIPIEKALNSVKINYPNNMRGSPVVHFYIQCLTVENGRVPFKGKDKTDDIFRAFALGCAKLIDPVFLDEHDMWGEDPDKVEVKRGSPVVMSSYSGNSGGGVPAGGGSGSKIGVVSSYRGIQ